VLELSLSIWLLVLPVMRRLILTPPQE
jgi:hypothetical protein